MATMEDCKIRFYFMIFLSLSLSSGPIEILQVIGFVRWNIF